MGETSNIAKMAERLSKDVFSKFLWSTDSSWNQNWPCERKEIHEKQTHPSDAVFFYDEPYSVRRTYVNCDLKSYAKGSITLGAVASAMENLAKSISCAEISETWRNLYLHEGRTAAIVGLLFIYNHDGGYDREFDTVLSSLKHEKLDIPAGSKLFILGPRQIQWLDNVRYEITQMRGNEELPPESQCRFHYPELVRRKNVQPAIARAATLEMLTGPWIVMEYGEQGKGSYGFLVFYRRRGETAEEFLYLLDYLMHYQMVKQDVSIQIRTFDTDPNAQAHFNRARTEYAETYGGQQEIGALLAKIQYQRITSVLTTFSEIELGMANG